MVWLYVSRGAGGTRGNRDTLEVETDDGGLRLQPRNRKKRGVRQPGHVAGEHNCPRCLTQAPLKAIPQAFEADRIAFPGAHGGLRCRAEARDSRNILGSSPMPQFLAAA